MTSVPIFVIPCTLGIVPGRGKTEIHQNGEWANFLRILYLYLFKISPEGYLSTVNIFFYRVS